MTTLANQLKNIHIKASENQRIVKYDEDRFLMNYVKNGKMTMIGDEGPSVVYDDEEFNGVDFNCTRKEHYLRKADHTTKLHYRLFDITGYYNIPDAELHREDGPAVIWYYIDGLGVNENKRVRREMYYRQGILYRDIWYNRDGSVKSDEHWREGISTEHSVMIHFPVLEKRIKDKANYN